MTERVEYVFIFPRVFANHKPDVAFSLQIVSTGWPTLFMMLFEYSRECGIELASKPRCRCDSGEWIFWLRRTEYFALPADLVSLTTKFRQHIVFFFSQNNPQIGSSYHFFRSATSQTHNTCQADHKTPSEQHQLKNLTQQASIASANHWLPILSAIESISEATSLESTIQEPTIYFS